MARKKQHISWSPMRALMRENGADIVSREAVDALINKLELIAGELTQTALKIAVHAKRKKITKSDLLLAITQKL